MTHEITGKKIQKKRIFGLPDILCISVVVVFALFFFFLGILPRLLGYSSYAISSGSMRPTLSRGDLLFVKPVDVKELSVGDIVAYRTDTDVIIHRIYSIDEETGSLWTKADASAQPDGKAVAWEQILGRAVYKIPLAGYFSLLLSGEGEETL